MWLLPPPLAHRVTASRVLDLDDVRAEVAEKLSAERAGQQLSELDDPQVLQRHRGAVGVHVGGHGVVWLRSGMGVVVRGPSTEARAL